MKNTLNINKMKNLDFKTMRKIAITLLMLLTMSLSLQAQMSIEQISEKYGITTKWAIEDDGSLSFSKVILSNDTIVAKDIIYDKVLSFFSYNYTDGKNVIQASDKETGFIIGKGVFPLCNDKYKTVSVDHIIKVECRNGKVRVIITVCDYDENGMAFPANVVGLHKRTVKITTMYPFTKFNKRTEKLTKDERIHDELFTVLNSVMNAVFGEIEKSINIGSSVLENEDW